MQKWIGLFDDFVGCGRIIGRRIDYAVPIQYFHLHDRLCVVRASLTRSIKIKNGYNSHLSRILAQ
jgi:hypothetical protein